jgi:hypothetical protein
LQLELKKPFVLCVPSASKGKRAVLRVRCWTEHELIDEYGPVAVAVAGTRGRSGLSNGAGQVEPKTVNPTKVDGSAGKTLSE